MIVRLDNSAGNIIGYKVSGIVGPEDYDIIVPEVTALVKEYEKIRLLLDVEDVEWERITAWAKDIGFGLEFRDKIEKLAIVTDKDWEKKFMELAAPFYAVEARTFPSPDLAWAWLQS